MSNIVLVHGAWVDGSGWQSVYRLLRGQGYNVSVVQHSTATLADDVRAVRQVLAAQDGPAVLVGHSYGGAVITRRAPMPGLRHWSTSPHSPPMRGSRWPPSSPIRRRAHRSRPSCRRRTAS